MRRYQRYIITKTETLYAVWAKTLLEAMERVLAGLGEQEHEDYPGPNIFVRQLEG
jgi:hypothetical protein